MAEPEVYRRYLTLELEVHSDPGDPTSDEEVAAAIVEHLEGLNFRAGGHAHTIDEAQEADAKAEADHERAQEEAIAERERALDATEEAVVWGPDYE